MFIVLLTKASSPGRGDIYRPDIAPAGAWFLFYRRNYKHLAPPGLMKFDRRGRTHLQSAISLLLFRLLLRPHNDVASAIRAAHAQQHVLLPGLLQSSIEFVDIRDELT